MKQQRTRVSAYGLITDANRMLLCRISSQLPRWEGQWTLPGGGIDFGEDPVDALVREVEEETGLIVEADMIAHIDSIHDDSRDYDFHGIRILYFAHKVGGSLRDEVDGTTDTCAWLTFAEIERMPLVYIAKLGAALVLLAQESNDTA